MKNEPQPETSSHEVEVKNNNLNPLLFVLGGVLVLAVGVLIGYLIFTRPTPIPILPSQDYPVDYQPRPVVIDQPTVDEPDVDMVDDEPVKDVTGGKLINWDGPREMERYGLNRNEGGDYDEVDYYHLGTVQSGSQKGAEILLVTAMPEGPAFYPHHYRFLRQGNQFSLITKHSDEANEWSGMDQTKFSTDDAFIIPELEQIPVKINGPQSRQGLQRDEYINAIFKDQNLKKAFTHKQLGDVYTTDQYPPENGEALINNRFGFYVRAADGTLVVYQYAPDFIGEDRVPSFAFNDRTVNTQEYIYTDQGGCGATNYAAVVNPFLVTLDDLKIIGQTNKGDEIYFFENPNHDMLRDFYEDKYFVYNGEKVAYEEFVANYPMLFFVDPFSRLIKMESNQFLPAAECGKPVIYLYPENDMKVSVKVDPEGGFTFTEPDYGNGWNVWTTTESVITDLNTGIDWPYLFWEGRGGIYQEPDKGWGVEVAEVESFLVDSLHQLGLNDKEIADFNEFWLPRMQDAPYYFISFYGNSTMDALAPLTIDPAPDTVIRVLMDFKPLDAPIDTEGYNLQAPEREGFTVVEWGGVLR